MLRFILYLFAFTATVFLLSAAIRYGLKGATRWDQKISSKLGRHFTGFQWYYRIPFSFGVVPEYYFFLVIGRDNYFNANWWALKTSGFLSFLMFLALLFNKQETELYYSLQTLREGGLVSYFTTDLVTFWYLHLINLLFVSVIVLIVVESIRMHGWYAPVRIFFYSLLSFLMYVLTITVLVVIIMVTLLYIAYRIIKFFMTSRRRRQEVDDDHDVSEKMNNRFRIFRAELYEWEAERITTRSYRHKDRKTEVRRKRPKIKRKRKSRPKKDDIPRYHPE